MRKAGFRARSSRNVIIADLGCLWLLKVVLNNFERIKKYKQSRMPNEGNTK